MTERMGLWSNLSDPLVARLAASAAFDWICIDEQHGTSTATSTGAILSALDSISTPVFVRVPWNRPEYISRALDSGANGVIVPLVSTATDAQAAAQATRFPPEGTRSWGPRPGPAAEQGGYGESANRALTCLVMVETAEGIENVEAIAATPGVDGIFVGPYDLSLALGITVDELLADSGPDGRLPRIIDACRRNGKIAGAYGGTPERARQMLDLGFEFVNVTTDHGMIETGARAALAAARG